MQESQPACADPILTSKLLDEMSHLVDEALCDAPGSCSNHAVSHAALESASKPIDSAGKAGNQPSAAHHTTGTSIVAQQGKAAAPSAQESLEQAPKASGSMKSSASVRSVSSKKASKPAWALTADAAQDAEQQEEADLLAFAGGLEFDEYINQQKDADLRTVLQV